MDESSGSSDESSSSSDSSSDDRRRSLLSSSDDSCTSGGSGCFACNVVGVMDDPHFACTDGTKFDFMGATGNFYSLLHQAETGARVSAQFVGAGLTKKARKDLQLTKKWTGTYLGELGFTSPSAVEVFVSAKGAVEVNGVAQCVSVDDAACKFATGDVSLTVAMVSTCAFHAPGSTKRARLSGKAVEAAVTALPCVTVRVDVADFGLFEVEAVPAKFEALGPKVNYLNMKVHSVEVTPQQDGIMGSCYGPTQTANKLELAVADGKRAVCINCEQFQQKDLFLPAEDTTVSSASKAHFVADVEADSFAEESV